MFSKKDAYYVNFRVGLVNFVLVLLDFLRALTLMHHHIAYTPIYSLSHLTY